MNPEALIQSMSQKVRGLLTDLGEDPDREGLVKTPERHAKAMLYLTSGYQKTPEEVVGDAIFHEECQEMVLVRDIEFYSLCEHHLVPFFGRAHIAYIPNGKIIGLSKLARLVDLFARRLQVQERMTSEIALAVNELLNPQGVGVILEAAHMCMMMRGVQKENSSTITSKMIGEFRDNSKTRSEFMSLIKKGRNL